MKIDEVSELTGINKKNIRFYESENLIAPKRNAENRYRDYNAEDVETLRMIKLFRKLGVSIMDIRLVQKGVIPIESCMIKYSKEIEKKRNELLCAKEICDDIAIDNTKGLFNTEKYLARIETREKQGNSFFAIAKDYINGAKGILPKAPEFSIFPDEPIMNKMDFTNELFKWGIHEHKEVQVLVESMEPIVKVDGEKYVGMLEYPHMVRIGFIRFFASNTYGFRMAYLYKLD